MTVTARVKTRARRAMMAAAFILALIVAVPAGAQQGESPEQLLEDFVHYGRIAKPDLAAAYGQALLEAGLSNAELATLVDEGQMDVERFEAAILRMMLVDQLEDIAAEISHRVELGRLDLARDAKRIEEAVQMLTGTLRQRMLAEERLEAAGEYAVPVLLRVITDGRDEALQARCEEMLRRIGRQAVTPLGEALPYLDPDAQRTICEILGDSQYPHAAPYLKELAIDPSTAGPVREAAQRALRTLNLEGVTIADLFTTVAANYFDQQISLIAYPFEETNNVWSYDPLVGWLTLTRVPTEIFSDIMAMRMAARALGHDRDDRTALSYFVAANLRRENDLPAGETDPIYGEAQYSPDFYATVFGTGVCRDVLALAIDATNTPLVRDAIGALSETTGGANLFSPDAGRQPLLESLSYPDRRVQYEAALVLGAALPSQSFGGDNRVVPILASAVRTGNQQFAIVIADDEENRQQATISAEGQGFTIVGAEGSVQALQGAIADAVGIDLVVIWMSEADAAEDAVQQLSQGARTAASPMLVIAPGVDVPGLRRGFRDNPRVMVTRPGIDETTFGGVVDALLQRAVGGRMTETESEVYAIESLSRLQDIAISGNQVYSLSDAESALLDALDQRSGGVRLLVADILALIDSSRAQRALFDAALAASGGEQIDLLDRVAESVKRHGNYAEPRHIAALVDLIENSSGSTAEGAARVHGALNLPSTDAIELIFDQ
jgi:hypothetical protein